VARQRPQANQTNPSTLTTTTTQYDLLGRVVSISYSDGTPTKNYLYDLSSAWGVTLQNPKGRIVYQGISNAQSIYSYDPMGRISWTGSCGPSNCGSWYYSANYKYDWVGNLTSADTGEGATETRTYTLANELQSITSSGNDSTHPPNLLSNVQSGPFGPVSWQLGNGLAGVRQYDAMGRTVGGWVCQGSSQANCSGGTQAYGFASGWKGSCLISASDSALGQSNAYGYDDFGRLQSLTVNSGNPGSYAYVYDRWGNRWQQNLTAGSGGPQPQLSFNTGNNQISNGGYAYDAAGNLTSDGTHSYSYDAEGNIAKVDGGSATYTYDALNERVRIDQTGNPSDEFFFNPAGQHTSARDVTDGWPAADWFYWGASPMAFYAAGVTDFDHQDWLGTERMRTEYNGSVNGTFTSLPFGDGYSANGNDWDPYHFAGLDQDNSSNDHAQFREYSNMSGRWMNPDRYGGSYDFSNPQSLNRYAYVQNNPFSFIDQSGLDRYFYADGCWWYSSATTTWNTVTQRFDVGVDLSPVECDAGSGGGGDGGGSAPNSVSATPPAPQPKKYTGWDWWNRYGSQFWCELSSSTAGDNAELFLGGDITGSGLLVYGPTLKTKAAGVPFILATWAKAAEIRSQCVSVFPILIPRVFISMARLL